MEGSVTRSSMLHGHRPPFRLCYRIYSAFTLELGRWYLCTAECLLRCASDLDGATQTMCDRDPINNTTAMEERQTREREIERYCTSVQSAIARAAWASGDCKLSSYKLYHPLTTTLAPHRIHVSTSRTDPTVLCVLAAYYSIEHVSRTGIHCTTRSSSLVPYRNLRPAVAPSL